MLKSNLKEKNKEKKFFLKMVKKIFTNIVKYIII